MQSLGTKNPREARIKTPEVLARFDAILSAARNGGAPLTQRAVMALCGEWYRAECARRSDNPGSDAEWEMELERLSDQLEETGPQENPEEWEHKLRLKPADCDEAAALLQQHGYTADPASVTQMAEALFWTRRDLAKAMLRRAEGDWSPDPTLNKFPALPAHKSPESPAPGITFDVLIAAWAAESGTQGKALYDRQRTAANLARHLGHDDATRMTADDVVSWKEARLAAGKSRKTVANDIGELRPIWTWGKRNRKLSLAENPFAGLTPRVKKGPRGPRGPYTDEHAQKLLQAARSETTALLRWLPWVLCFTGCRIAEACQSRREDVNAGRKQGSFELRVLV